MRVLADGCFDPLHVGHLSYLRSASIYGTLYVHIAPDDAIRAKGREPFQSRQERAVLVNSLDMVRGTWMRVSLAEAIRDIKPHYLVKGSDWCGKLPEDVLKACQEVGAQIVYTETQSKTSTERLNPYGHFKTEATADWNDRRGRARAL